MSTAINTGGPAFPVNDMQSAHATAAATSFDIADPAERERVYILARAAAVIGMSMRDFFAANADVPWEVAADAIYRENGNKNGSVSQILAKRSQLRYEHADEMLKVRAAS